MCRKQTKMPAKTRNSATGMASDNFTASAAAAQKTRRTLVYLDRALTNEQLYNCLEESPSLSSASKRTYATNLRSLLAQLGTLLLEAASHNTNVIVCPDDGADYRLYQVIAAGAAAAKVIHAAASIPLRTKAAYVSAILALYKHSSCISQETAPQLMTAKPAWETLCKELSNQLDKVARQSRLSAREEKAWCSIQELQNKLAELERERPGSREHLVLAWYISWPPLRGGDGARIRIVQTEEPTQPGDDGVLIWNSNAGASARDGGDTGTSSSFSTCTQAELVLQHHKTAGKYGALRRAVPPQLCFAIETSLHAEPREYLFTQAHTAKPFNSPTAFTNWANQLLKRLMGRPITCNTLRHVYISSVDLPALTLGQQEALATWMGHSLLQQAKYRRVTMASTGREESSGLQAADGSLNIPLRKAPIATTASS